MCARSADRQERKLKTFKGIKGRCLTQLVEKHPEYEVKWQFKALDQNTWAEKKSLPMGYISKCSMRTNGKQPRNAS